MVLAREDWLRPRWDGRSRGLLRGSNGTWRGRLPFRGTGPRKAGPARPLSLSWDCRLQERRDNVNKHTVPSIGDGKKCHSIFVKHHLFFDVFFKTRGREGVHTCRLSCERSV